jgi:ComF family protein
MTWRSGSQPLSSTPAQPGVRARPSTTVKIEGMSLLAQVGRFVGGAAGRALDVALPGVCAGCNREGLPLCDDCRPALDVRLTAVPGVPLGLPADLPEPLLQLEWCAPFTGVTRRALHELKYGGERRLARPLGEAIAARWSAAGSGGEILVPVPASPKRVRDRGYDQAVLLATEAGRRLGLPVVEAVRRARDTEAQFDLGREARGRNVRDAFVVTEPSRINARWVILVDDVVTTGATLAGCAAQLLTAGALGVSGVTVARER